MKKVLSILLSVLLVAGMFAGCSSKKGADQSVDENKIHIRQADMLIRSYTQEELELTDEEYANIHFLYSESDPPVEIDGVKYYTILASNIVETGEFDEEGNPFVSPETVKKYYVTLDGTKAYIVDLETEELKQLPEKEVPQLSDAEKAALTTNASAQETDNSVETHTHIHADETHDHTHAE